MGSHSASTLRRRFQLERGEHLSVVWVQPKSYRLCSYGEVAEAQRRERWWFRRIGLLLVALCICYPLSIGFWRAVLRVYPGAIATAVDPVVDLLTLPISLVCALACPPLTWLMRQYEEGCVRWLQGTGHGVVPSATASLAATVVLVVIWCYALSPIAYWMLARFCGFAHLPHVTMQMEWVYSPLQWIVNRSRTAYAFYTQYFELQEELD